MFRPIIIIFFLTTSFSVAAQKDTITALKKNKVVQQTIITSAQKLWLDSNYKKLHGMSKKNAALVVKQNFAGIPEASLEYMIGLAAKLSAADNQQQIAQMRQMLELLKSQKNALLNQIRNKEAQLAATTDELKKARLVNEIILLEMQLNIVEQQITAKNEAIKKLKDD